MGDVFNPTRLRLARQRRGLTSRALAGMLQIGERNLSHYENGTAVPPGPLVDELAHILNVHPEFFVADDPDVLPVEAVSFRALSKMSVRQRDAAIAAGVLAMELDRWLAERFHLPAVDVPTLDHPRREPEAAAREVRARWGMGEGAAPNMIHLLEAHGVRIYSLATDCAEVDAFSTWWRGTPYVFLNTLKSGERSRFDAAHELGHLVLHGTEGVPHGPDAERQANAFAAAFLMPTADVLTRGLRHATIDRVLQEKARWKVSAMALTHRLNEIGLLTEWGYRSLCIELSKRGYRSGEPGGMAAETSQVLNKMFAALRQQGVSVADVAASLGLTVDELNRHVFGLIVTALDGGTPTSARGRDHLRLVP